MSTPIELGFEPEQLTVNLSPGSAFASGLRDQAGDWPGDAVIRLVFNMGDDPPVEWAATIVDDLATFSEDASAVDEVIASPSKRVQLWYGSGSAAVEWASGRVEVSG